MAFIPPVVYRALSRARNWRAIKYKSHMHPVRWLDDHPPRYWWDDMLKWWRS